MRSAVIVDAVRTPSGRGKPGGALSGVHPADLAGIVLTALLERNGLESAQVDDVILGCVSQLGDQAMNIARQAVLSAGFDERVPATTIDRQCGSSQQAAHFAAQGVIAGAYDVVIAGGVESMSRVPLGSSTAGGSVPDGIRRRYPEGLVNQGVSAELIADRWEIMRDELDAFAAESHRRAAEAWRRGWFDRQVTPVLAGGSDAVAFDETVREGTTVHALAGLSPAFRTDELAARFPRVEWRITAGSSSPLTDAASAVLIMAEETAAALGLTPRARFHSFAVVGDDPLLMLTGPIPATRRILDRSGLAVDDIDVFEVNEAFASVPLAWQREFDVDPEIVNPWGGAIALGHAVGASGTRLMATLVDALEQCGGRYGLQTMCEGGGLANATILERL
ncbi:MAG: acetyl-CoA C-acyltransferase [Zunongwangia sp.]|uniref:thiolase family protein n=1 Tax=unclassified Microbacterium TaxID=2609290 RepID=UPI000C4BA4E5|nr:MULTISPECIES: thiolase family protein [unclassified Microbacterium]MAO34826.1 acetyl-CoA C-acyltransferase [Zunongwangia sp.]MAM54296.1 acetyl-CoA C-acyltransferase [Microbacterium sp.]MAY50402.1 acetyl-CoA C-acyltransferase [Microbacterium sp.]HAS31332.1 steroid 3-ketoacyl-CoA thiolase [Microbacterium sp.]HBR88279.1 steroid 3-ketoacyl-CoA thiolase [Microbacterium sp.]|tara:strand:+ start:473 stop:1651 length:1179 start_codon:yes stop_codon:yes gene_type:complete